MAQTPSAAFVVRNGLVCGDFSAAEFFGEREVADVFDDGLAFVTANPGEIFFDGVFIERGIHVDVEITPDGICLVDDVFFGGLDGFATRFLADHEVFGSLAVGRAAVADGFGIARDGLQEDGGAGHGLRAGGKITAAEDVFLEEFVSAGAIFAAVDGDGLVLAADFLPLANFAGEDVL